MKLRWAFWVALIVSMGALVPAAGAAATIASAAVHVAPPDRLPTGPAWVAGDRCIPRDVARSSSTDDTARLPSWHTGASLQTALAYAAAMGRNSEVCTWGQEGWLALPAGWREQSFTEGFDGNAGWLFVAPGGARNGWESITEIPACVGCMLGQAQGLFPDAHAQYEVRLDTRLPVETLSPVPYRLTRPNRCVVDLAYRSHGLDVRGQAYWDHNDMDDGYVDVFVALPSVQARLRPHMLASFRAPRPPTQRFCAKDTGGARRKASLLPPPRPSRIHWPTVQRLPTGQYEDRRCV